MYNVSINIIFVIKSLYSVGKKRENGEKIIGNKVLHCHVTETVFSSISSIFHCRRQLVKTKDTIILSTCQTRAFRFETLLMDV